MQHTLNLENIFSGTGSPIKETIDNILSNSPLKTSSPSKKTPIKFLKKENLGPRDFGNESQPFEEISNWKTKIQLDLP
jgi:hypothetical protein